MQIDMDELEYGYNPKYPVLKGIDLRLDKPEFVCIMGPNGVGKSTLIHCINKILKPTGGSVFLDGRDVSEMKLKEVAEHLGYVPATSEDSFPLTVVDTVMVGLQNDFKFGTTKDDLARVYDVLRLMKIEHLAMRNFNELSAGQHQKVVLARGLVRTPPAVLLDEPTSNLDIKHQIEVVKVLSRLPKEKGMLVVMISHDINITAKFADRIVMIHDGEIFADGDPSDVLTKENIRTVYGVDADIIQVNGRPHVILNDSIDGRSSIRAARPGLPVCANDNRRPVIGRVMKGNGRIAVVGLGSPIMCDDAVGLRVSDAIRSMGMPDVDCFEEAVGGLDILPIIHGYTHAIVVDAIQTGEYGPGTVMLMSEHDFDDVIAHAATHDVNLPTAIKIGRQMDPDLMPETIMFVAVEVQDIKTVTETMTPEVEAAVDSAKAAVLHLMDSVRNRDPRCACS